MDVDLITSNFVVQEMADFEIKWDDEEEKAGRGHRRVRGWHLLPDTGSSINAKFTGFLPVIENEFEPRIWLNFTGAYTRDVEEDQMLAAEPQALNGTVELAMGEFRCDYKLQFFYIMESWYLAASHMRPDAVVEPSLRQLFQDTYMLVVVKAARDLHTLLCPFRRKRL